MPRLNFFVAGAVFLKHPQKIVKTYWNSEVKCRVNFSFSSNSRKNASFLIFKASFLKEVSRKSFVFELQSFIFEGSLAQKLRF